MAPPLPAGRHAFRNRRCHDPEKKSQPRARNRRAFSPPGRRISRNAPTAAAERCPKSISNRYARQRCLPIPLHIAQREPESVALYATTTREPLRYMQRNPRNVALLRLISDAYVAYSAKNAPSNPANEPDVTTNEPGNPTNEPSKPTSEPEARRTNPSARVVAPGGRSGCRRARNGCDRPGMRRRSGTARP